MKYVFVAKFQNGLVYLWHIEDHLPLQAYSFYHFGGFPKVVSFTCMG
jgi:hypothetical protein